MYSDDIFALTIDIGHSKSVIGYAGDETPKYYTDSVVGHATADTHPTKISFSSEMADDSAQSTCIFGEQIAANLKNMEIDNILENSGCKLSAIDICSADSIFFILLTDLDKNF